MQHPNDAALAQLQADWPDWQIWIVHRHIGGPVWCARRRDDHKRVLNADSAEHLAEYLENETGLSGGPSRGLPALRRLIQATGTWAIAYHPDLECWSAERAEGTAIRYLVAHSAAELATKIDAAETDQ